MQLRTHADVLRQRAERVIELRPSLEPVVMNESAWVGPDADAFGQSRSGQTAQLFELRGEDLRGLVACTAGRGAARPQGALNTRPLTLVP